MRVLVCGGRDFDDRLLLQRTLDRINDESGIDVIIEGGARGADRLAGAWAIERGIQTLVYLADWAKHGKSAGPIRNKQMLAEGKPDLVVGFPGGRGTSHMLAIARGANIRAVEVGRDAPNVITDKGLGLLP